MVEFTPVRQGYLTGTIPQGYLTGIGTYDYPNAANANVKNENKDIILICRTK